MGLKEKEDDCFIPEKENPYIGRNLEKCKDCQLHADWESDEAYGAGR